MGVKFILRSSGICEGVDSTISFCRCQVFRSGPLAIAVRNQWVSQRWPPSTLKGTPLVQRAMRESCHSPMKESASPEGVSRPCTTSAKGKSRNPVEVQLVGEIEIGNGVGESRFEGVSQSLQPSRCLCSRRQQNRRARLRTLMFIDFETCNRGRTALRG